MKNQVGSSRMDTVLKLLLVAFISLLAFSSGVYFGKQLSDSDYQLKALESDFSSQGGAQAKNEHGSGRDEAINEEEVAALSDKWVNSEKEEMAKNDGHGDDHGPKNATEKGHGTKTEDRKIASDDHGAHGGGHDDHAAPAKKADAHGAPAKADAHAAPAKAAKADHAAPAKAAAKKDDHGGHDDHHAAGDAPAPKAGAKPDLSAAHKAAVRVANNAAPAEPEKPATEERKPNSLPKTVGSTRDVEFTVQVASYPTSEAAKEHANDLVKKGFPAFPVEATINGKTWYRVSVGSFKSQKEAVAYRGQLLKQTSLPSAIVQRIQR